MVFPHEIYTISGVTNGWKFYPKGINSHSFPYEMYHFNQFDGHGSQAILSVRIVTEVTGHKANVRTCPGHCNFAFYLV